MAEGTHTRSVFITTVCVLVLTALFTTISIVQVFRLSYCQKQNSHFELLILHQTKMLRTMLHKAELTGQDVFVPLSQRRTSSHFIKYMYVNVLQYISIV